MRVIVAGGRDFTDRGMVFTALDGLHRETPITVLVHGGCRGADSLADDWANSRAVSISIFPADWKHSSRKAGPLRNQAMVDAGADMLLTFPGGRGTADIERRAEKAGIQCVDGCDLAIVAALKGEAKMGRKT